MWTHLSVFFLPFPLLLWWTHLWFHLFLSLWLQKPRPIKSAAQKKSNPSKRNKMINNQSIIQLLSVDMFIIKSQWSDTDGHLLLKVSWLVGDVSSSSGGDEWTEAPCPLSGPQPGVGGAELQLLWPSDWASTADTKLHLPNSELQKQKNSRNKVCKLSSPLKLMCWTGLFPHGLHHLLRETSVSLAAKCSTI